MFKEHQPSLRSKLKLELSFDINLLQLQTSTQDNTFEHFDLIYW